MGKSLSGSGNARGKGVGDVGSMHAIGVRSVSKETYYKTEENTTSKVSLASTVFRDWSSE